ncbi:hypothetical protein EZV62_019126 [Acer yangbiense]|uniref:WAT1-related protein n=1 Tax=Acer yangbiense TaxID=1000413 RepID=A0A5C7HA08_9ROSI|nr:hypothetical protein EZV62_019126 [Acer yangbiense]
MKLYKKKMGPIEMCEALKGVKPVMVMVVVQIAYAGMNIFYKLAANDGMNLRVLVAYRMMFATVFIAPLALIFERGLLAQNLYIESLYLTSASFASAVTNLIPAVTFVLAVSFSIIGAVLIACGLYMVLWGKNKEMKKKTQILPSKSSQGSKLVEIVNDTHLKSNVDITDDEASLENEQEIRELKV